MTPGQERQLFDAVAADPDNAAARIVYADWLEQAGDRRAGFVRQHLETAPLPPDHPDRAAGEQALSRHRLGLDPAWLAVIEPERRHHYMSAEARCDCFARQPEWRLELHREPQDTECDAWKILLDYVERAASDRRLRFQPRPEMSAAQWTQIVTLPPTIGKLTAITAIDLQGSHLVRIPPEIGQMTSLRWIDLYMSYRLHWYPYELTRCAALRGSTVSTRALYGNYNHRWPFPELAPTAPRTHGPLRPCSVCEQPFEDLELHRVWISLRAGDVLPLLVNACSAECVARLPAPPEGYVPQPHRGGRGVKQPRKRM